jgi:predicted aminopeptidase
MRLFNRGRPLQEVISDPRTDRGLAKLLSGIPGIKSFGEASGLKATPNYREYVELGADSVVYVVTVSEKLRFQPVIFKFPLVGSFSYLGWFSEEDAREFSGIYAARGLDVDVRGASAYSTLGWFKDPLLSSMIPKMDGKVLATALPELVNVFLHESVHATLYLPNQSSFNESLASFTADILTARYFEKSDPEQKKSWEEFQENQKRFDSVRKRLSRAYRDLKSVYDSPQSEEEKATFKMRYLESLQAELKFKRKITNATLIQFQTYSTEDRGFQALFEASGREIPRFLQTLSRLTPEDFGEPQIEDFKPVLERLLKSMTAQANHL